MHFVVRIGCRIPTISVRFISLTSPTNNAPTDKVKMNRLKIAKLGFVIAAAASFLFSVSLWFTGSRDEGVFVGIWVPSILSFGALVLSGRSSDG